MKSTMRYCVALLFLSLDISTAWAIPDTVVTHGFNNSINLSGPADNANNRFGSVIANSGSRLIRICNNSTLNYNLAKIDYTPLIPWTGNTHQASSAHRMVYLYDSGVPGLNIVPMIRGDSFNIVPEMSGSGVFNPAAPQPLVLWTGNMTSADRIANGFWVFNMVYLYRGMERIESNTLISQQPLYRYTCYDNNNVAQETVTVVFPVTSINVSVTGCTPSAKTATINMAGVPVSNIENATSSDLINTQQQTFSLNCDPNIRLYYSVVDLNDPTNNSNIATLTSDSTAAGVGYTITSPAGTRLQFGPDGSAIGIPGQIQYYIGGGATTGNGPVPLQLGFSYVRKPSEAIKTGSAKSLIGITYSYQ